MNSDVFGKLSSLPDALANYVFMLCMQEDQLFWVYPTCKNELIRETSNVICSQCDVMYPLVGSIPDLRLAGDSWLDHDEDLDQARFLLR